jgi:hypothetical protein
VGEELSISRTFHIIGAIAIDRNVTDTNKNAMADLTTTTADKISPERP